MLSHQDSVRLHGPWTPRTPDDVATLLADYPGRWWIAGGWAIEAFTGASRPHSDVDPSIPRSDVGLLRAHLAGRLDVWSADGGTLRPLLEESDDAGLPARCENLWLRASGADPWEYDVILMDTTATTWTFKRDQRVSLPLEEILWHRDGVAYLRPEVQLLHKARARREQDEQDLEACVPLLADDARRWLVRALDLAHPGHPWLGALAG